MKKMPICKICAISGVLCGACTENVESGKISSLDIEYTKELLELEKKFKVLNGITFLKANEIGDMVVLQVGKGDLAKISGQRGRILRELEKSYPGKRFRFIEKSKDIKRILENLVAPARILGINQIYLPTGETESKVRIYKSDQKKLPASIEILEDVVYSLTNEHVRIALE
ncbi:MAG: hypothetical protein ACTSVY_15145 [Candidatus Helarchaeota archaeon]